jgi:hypothetical protein
MDINPLGLITATTAFLSIWIGHVSVRKVEALTVRLWKPMIVAIALGLTLEYAAISISNRHLAAVCGILGTTLLWDAFEIKRQARRVRKGHSPANPNNPRHAALLREPNSAATTLDILNRDPVGRLVDPEEAIRLVKTTDFRGIA